MRKSAAMKFFFANKNRSGLCFAVRIDLKKIPILDSKMVVKTVEIEMTFALQNVVRSSFESIGLENGG